MSTSWDHTQPRTRFWRVCRVAVGERAQAGFGRFGEQLVDSPPDLVAADLCVTGRVLFKRARLLSGQRREQPPMGSARSPADQRRHPTALIVALPAAMTEAERVIARRPGAPRCATDSTHLPLKASENEFHDIKDLISGVSLRRTPTLTGDRHTERRRCNAARAAAQSPDVSLTAGA
jgi:hypothetical protein